MLIAGWILWQLCALVPVHLFSARFRLKIFIAPFFAFDGHLSERPLRPDQERQKTGGRTSGAPRPSSFPAITLLDLAIMPPKKRRRPTSAVKNGNAASSASPSATKPVSLEDFSLLPLELKQHIIGLACLAPSSSSSSPPSKRSLFTTDTATALALCLASKELSALAASSLYRAIIITRPSALYYLYRTLEARPERAKLTRRLHLGPLDALPADWWPLDNAFPEGEGWSAKDNRSFGLPYTWVRSTLSQSELPCGYQAGHAWALGRTLPGCREAAISDALQAAQDYLDVNIKREASQASTTKVIGILEVQAALDVYLGGVRDSERYDDKLIKLAQPGARVPLGCRNGNCKHYMAFSITGTGHRRYSYRRTWPLGGVHQTSRLVILRHLARPGSTTDRFDHPLLLARSGFDVSVTTGLGKGHKEQIPGRRTFYVVRSETWELSDVHEKHEWPDLAALQKDQHQWKQGYKWGDESDEDKEWCRGMVTRNKILINTGTLGQTLRLARSVYGLLPNLEDVSLTGIFEAIFDYTQGVEQLRRLSFGPSPPFWDTQLALSGFEQLERLHICGIAVTEEELLCITNEMPQLKEFQWSMFEEITSIYELR